MKFPKEQRQAHLKLDEPCIEIGGNSENFRGLLCFTVKTTMPKGIRIHLCHACHNGKCGNPYHLYWGTPKDNFVDVSTLDSFVSFPDRIVNKFGKEGALEIARNGGKANKGILKSEATKAKISATKQLSACNRTALRTSYT